MASTLCGEYPSALNEPHPGLTRFSVASAGTDFASSETEVEGKDKLAELVDAAWVVE
jgi:hypothetical protein